MELKESPDRGVYVKDLSQFVCKNYEEMNKVLKVGLREVRQLVPDWGPGSISTCTWSAAPGAGHLVCGCSTWTGL